jgi:hypothetical protein
VAEIPKISITFTVEAEDAESLILLHSLLTRSETDLSCLSSFNKNITDKISGWLMLAGDAVQWYEYGKIFPDEISERFERARRIILRGHE